MTFTLPNEGYFEARMTYFDQHIIDADLGILCVSRKTKAHTLLFLFSIFFYFGSNVV